MENGFLKETIDLIQSVEKENNFDYKKHKSTLFSIETKVKGSNRYHVVYDALLQQKLKNLHDTNTSVNSMIILAYLDMVKELSESKNVFRQCSIIYLMIPVICELIRENDR